MYLAILIFLLILIGSFAAGVKVDTPRVYIQFSSRGIVYRTRGREAKKSRQRRSKSS